MNNQNSSCPEKYMLFHTDWLTRRQASKYLQCGICTLDTRLPIRKYYLGKSVRYLRSDLDEFLLSNCKEPFLKKKKDGK